MYARGRELLQAYAIIYGIWYFHAYLSFVHYLQVKNIEKLNVSLFQHPAWLVACFKLIHSTDLKKKKIFRKFQLDSPYLELIKHYPYPEKECQYGLHRKWAQIIWLLLCDPKYWENSFVKKSIRCTRWTMKIWTIWQPDLCTPNGVRSEFSNEVLVIEWQRQHTSPPSSLLCTLSNGKSFKIVH